jgi:hypothetical protein
MKSTYLSTFALAALLGTAPAWSQFTDSAKTSTTAKTSPPPAATSVTPTSKPLCSTLDHPQAGKLADKRTGKAKDHSASAVHQDCIPDTQPGSKSGTTASTDTSVSPSSSSSTASSATGASTDANTSVTGSTSTVSPSIDLRGRSSVTIDNTTTTGSQSATTNATTSSGSQTSGNRNTK